MSVGLMHNFDDESYLNVYNYNRTPSYAVKFLQEAIQSRPIVESQLLRHKLVSSGTDHDNKINLKENSIRLSGGPVSGSSWNRDALELIDSGRSSHIEPTRTTLLRERISSSKSTSRRRECFKSISIPTRPSSGRDSIPNRYQYGYLVGARYTKQNFINRAADQYSNKSRSQFSAQNLLKFDPETTNNIPTSPQNSPRSPTIEVTPDIPQQKSPEPFLEPSPEIIPSITTTENQHHQDQTKDQQIYNSKETIELSHRSYSSTEQTAGSNSANKCIYDIKKPISMPRRPPSAQLKVSFSRTQQIQSAPILNLPTVTGFSFLNIQSLCPSQLENNEGSPVARSVATRTSLSRAELNLHFSRMNRNLRNRRTTNSTNNCLAATLTTGSTSKSSYLGNNRTHQQRMEFAIQIQPD